MDDQNSNSTGRQNPINRIQANNANQNGLQAVNHEDSSHHSEAQSDGNPNVIIINDVENDANNNSINNNSYNNLSEIVDYMVGDIGNNNSSNTDINSNVANNNNANNNSFENIVNFAGIDDNRSNITLESADGRDCCKNGCGCPGCPIF